MSWTHEREKKLRDLWGKGHTANQIADMLGNTTRNAVIGKAHRLKLAARAHSKNSQAKSRERKNQNQITKPNLLTSISYFFSFSTIDLHNIHI